MIVRGAPVALEVQGRELAARDQRLAEIETLQPALEFAAGGLPGGPAIEQRLDALTPDFQAFITVELAGIKLIVGNSLHARMLEPDGRFVSPAISPSSGRNPGRRCARYG